MVARPMLQLPQLLATDPASIQAWASQLILTLQNQIQVMNAPASTWAVSGVTTNRTFDAATATLAQTAQALGTLITDLGTAGAVSTTPTP